MTRLLVARGKRVLITSYTHGAVDNLMIKLMKSGVGNINPNGDVDMVRVGRESQCHPLVQDLLVTKIAKLKDQDNDQFSMKSLRTALSNARIVGCSALTGMLLFVLVFVVHVCVIPFVPGIY